MTYVAGSTSNTANPAKDFMELILHPNLLTAGFTYVEEVLGPTTVVTRIYKSAAAANGVGDWHLIVYRGNDTTQSVGFGVCEDYDSTGHLAKKWAPITVTGGQTLPADRSHYTTAGIVPYQVVQGSQFSVGLSTTVHSYILSVHPKRVVVATKVISTESAIYAGLYEPLLPGISNHFPLVITTITTASGGNPYTTYTREPGTGTTVATTSGAGSFTANVGMAHAGWVIIGDPSSLDGYTGKPSVTRFFCPPSQSKSAGFRGMPIGIYAADTVFAWGDIVNVDWSGGVTNVGTCIFSASGNNQQRVVEQM